MIKISNFVVVTILPVLNLAVEIFNPRSFGTLTKTPTNDKLSKVVTQIVYEDQAVISSDNENDHVVAA